MICVGLFLKLSILYKRSEKGENDILKIYNVNYIDALPKNASFPCLLLAKNSWDDYGYKTTYTVRFYTDKNKYEDLDYLKILNINNKNTRLYKEVTQLSQEFCSLGQSTNYYEKLSNLPRKMYQDILIRLNDVVFNRQIHDEFSVRDEFHKTLLRENSALTALVQGSEILEKRVKIRSDEDYSFRFNFLIPGSTDPVKLYKFN